MRHQAATCVICDEPIYVEIEDGMSAPATRVEVQRAATAHLHTHPEPVVAHFYLSAVLDRLAPNERALAVREIYGDLRKLWGDRDARGLYSIDEALGSVAMYRLWHAASACSGKGCRHTP